MKKFNFLSLFVFLFTQCAESQVIKKIVIDETDPISGYYLAIPPAGKQISGVLVLLPGFSQRVESILPETKLHNVAMVNQLLTVCFAGGQKLYADQPIQEKLTAVLEDVLERYEVPNDKFVIGGFSAGGIIALRYVELCNEFPQQFPIQPQGVFMVDSPIDLFTIWNNFEESVEENHSKVAVDEANYVMNIIKKEHGIPRENIDAFSKLSPFSMNKEYGENERFLKDVAVRAYHDVDIPWRIINRNQPVRVQNYLMTAELINRLLLLGNERAEFIQSYQTGYRANGMRHPHSWSVVEEVECIQWVKGLLK